MSHWYLQTFVCMCTRLRLCINSTWWLQLLRSSLAPHLKAHKSLSHHYKYRRHNLVPRPLPAVEKNQEKAWDCCYITGRKWWTWLVHNVDSICTVSTISSSWRSNDSRPPSDRLRYKIWEWPGNEAMEYTQHRYNYSKSLLHVYMYLSNSHPSSLLLHTHDKIFSWLFSDSLQVMLSQFPSTWAALHKPTKLLKRRPQMSTYKLKFFLGVHTPRPPLKCSSLTSLSNVLWASPFRPIEPSMCSVWGTRCTCAYLVKCACY